MPKVALGSVPDYVIVQERLSVPGHAQRVYRRRPRIAGNGCMQVLRGSYRMGHRSWFRGEQTAPISNVVNESNTLSWSTARWPGTALLFHGNLLHRSDANSILISMGPDSSVTTPGTTILLYGHHHLQYAPTSCQIRPSNRLELARHKQPSDFWLRKKTTPAGEQLSHAGRRQITSQSSAVLD